MCTCSDELHIVLAAYLQGFVQQQNPKLDQWTILLHEKVAVFVSTVMSKVSNNDNSYLVAVFNKKLLGVYKNLSILFFNH